MVDTLVDVFCWKKLAKYYYDKNDLDNFSDYLISSGKDHIKLPFDEWDDLFAKLKMQGGF